MTATTMAAMTIIEVVLVPPWVTFPNCVAPVDDALLALALAEMS